MVNAIYSSTGFQFDVGVETAFNSGTVGTDLGALGIMAQFTSYELDNNWTELYEIGQRYPQAFYSAGLKAPTAIEFYMCQDQIGWLGFALGAAVGGTYTVGNTIQTGQVSLWTPQNNVFTVGGIVFNTAKISTTQGSPVSVSLNGVGTSFSSAGGTIVPGAIPSTLLTWKDCSILTGTVAGNVYGTITSSLVESFDFTIDNSAKMFYALGSASYQTYLPLQSVISGNITAFHNDSAYNDIYSAIVGNSVAQGGTLGIAIGTRTALFTGTYLTKGSLQLAPVKEAMNTLSFHAKQVAIW